MTLNQGSAFWREMHQLVKSHKIVIDRLKGTPHPRFSDFIYPLDYGYIEGTTAADGDGIDVWVGSTGGRELTGIFCTFDTLKHDAEIKLLLGCSAGDIETIFNFYATRMRALYIPNPLESA